MEIYSKSFSNRRNCLSKQNECVYRRCMNTVSRAVLKRSDGSMYMKYLQKHLLNARYVRWLIRCNSVVCVCVCKNMIDREQLG